MNLLIVDDEPAARVGLIRLCERAPDMHVVGEAGTGAKAIEAVESLRPDLMLLDADLPDMSGFDVLRALRRRHQRRTILVTASARDAPGAFAAGAIDYLVKPVNEAAFSDSILRARARGMPRPAEARRLHPAMTAARGDSDARRPLLLVGEREHRLYPLDPYQIDYVESAGNYVTYHLSGVEYIARESLKRLEHEYALRAELGRMVAEVEEQPPVDRPVRREVSKTNQAVARGSIRPENNQPLQICVQPVNGPDHGVTEAVSRGGKFNRHKRLVLPVKKLQLVVVEVAIAFQ